MLVGLKSGDDARFKSPYERRFFRCFPGPILLTGLTVSAIAASFPLTGKAAIVSLSDTDAV